MSQWQLMWLNRMMHTRFITVHQVEDHQAVAWLRSIPIVSSLVIMSHIQSNALNVFPLYILLKLLKFLQNNMVDPYIQEKFYHILTNVLILIVYIPLINQKLQPSVSFMQDSQYVTRSRKVVMVSKMGMGIRNTSFKMIWSKEIKNITFL